MKKNILIFIVVALDLVYFYYCFDVFVNLGKIEVLLKNDLNYFSSYPDNKVIKLFRLMRDCWYAAQSVFFSIACIYNT
jgi:hypothetical protein